MLAPFADTPVPTPPGTPWWVTVLVGAGAAAATFLVRVYTEQQKRKRLESVEDRQHKKEDDNEIIKGKDELIERYKRANDEDKRNYESQMADMRAEVGQLRTKLEACMARQQAAEKTVVKYGMRIQHLEEILESKKIPFRPMKDDDSGVMIAPQQPAHDKEPF